MIRDVSVMLGAWPSDPPGFLKCSRWPRQGARYDAPQSACHVSTFQLCPRYANFQGPTWPNGSPTPRRIQNPESEFSLSSPLCYHLTNHEHITRPKKARHHRRVAHVPRSSHFPHRPMPLYLPCGNAVHLQAVRHAPPRDPNCERDYSFTRG